MEITQHKIQIPVQTSHLAGLRRQMEKICKQHSVPALTTRRMVLAIDEALTNIIVHGKMRPHEQVDLSVEIDDDQIVAELQDAGVPFDPSLDRGGPDPKSFPHRGFGLYLIHLIADEVEYERTADGRNILKMLKTLH
jgi:serine/threonine-protein kinase RsbW